MAEVPTLASSAEDASSTNVPSMAQVAAERLAAFVARHSDLPQGSEAAAPHASGAGAPSMATVVMNKLAASANANDPAQQPAPLAASPPGDEDLANTALVGRLWARLTRGVVVPSALSKRMGLVVRTFLLGVMIGVAAAAILWGSDSGAGAEERALLAQPYGGLLTQPLPGGARRVAMLACAYTRDTPAAVAWLEDVRARVTNETLHPLPLTVRDFNSRRCLVGRMTTPPPLLLRAPNAHMEGALPDILKRANASGALANLLASAPAQEVFLVKAARTPEEALATGEWTQRAPFGLVRLFYRVVGATADGELQPLLIEHHDLLALAEQYGPTAALRKRQAHAGATAGSHRTCFCPVYLGLFQTGFVFDFQPQADNGGGSGWRLIVGLKLTDAAPRDVAVALDPLQIETAAMARRRKSLTTLVANRAPAYEYVRPDYVYYAMYHLVPTLLEPQTYFSFGNDLTDMKFWSELHNVNGHLENTFARADYVHLLRPPAAAWRDGDEDEHTAQPQSPPPPQAPPLAATEEAFILPFQRLPRPIREVAVLGASAQDCLAYCEVLEHRILTGAMAAAAAAAGPDMGNDEGADML